MGIFFIILKGNVSFLLFFLLITLVFPESGRFVYLLSGILAGMGLSALATMLSNSSQNHLITIAVSVLLTLVLGFLSYKGYKELAKRSPRLYTETLELAEYVQENIPTNQKYLALVAKDEAEWMPFLFEREPVIGHWGSEWLGTFNEQTYFMSLFRGCLHNQDWSCVKRTFSIIDVNPSYVISCVGDRILYYEIQLDDAWENIYENDRYVVWKR